MAAGADVDEACPHPGWLLLPLHAAPVTIKTPTEKTAKDLFMDPLFVRWASDALRVGAATGMHLRGFQRVATEVRRAATRTLASAEKVERGGCVSFGQ